MQSRCSQCCKEFGNWMGRFSAHLSEVQKKNHHCPLAVCWCWKIGKFQKKHPHRTSWLFGLKIRRIFRPIKETILNLRNDWKKNDAPLWGPSFRHHTWNKVLWLASIAAIRAGDECNQLCVGIFHFSNVCSLELRTRLVSGVGHALRCEIPPTTKTKFIFRSRRPPTF